MRPLPLLFVLFAGISCQQASAQSKSDKRAAEEIRTDITYLAGDELQGRRTGTEGERKAAEYIENRYKQQGIGPYKGRYEYPFHFVHGKEIAAQSVVTIGEKPLQINEEVFPLPFTASGQASGESLPNVMEAGTPWLINLYADQAEADDLHFDWERSMYNRSKEAAEQGAVAVLFYDGFGSYYAPYFNDMSEYDRVSIPVAFMINAAYKRYIADTTGSDTLANNVKVAMNVAVNRSERTGTNIAAFIDNNAPYTVVLGAHYDHLGMGEDGNSLYTGKEKQVHRGADDNASGTAALLEIAKWIKLKKLHKYNYLFINFSGEELGLLGSKAFVKENGMDSNHIAYMINMDMVGRLNDSTHALYVGGVGTSPAWANVLDEPKRFKYIIDSSGIGPSDHSSFYHAGIPVLFFFTGMHKDYHKPTDVAEKINYNGEVRVLKHVYNIVEMMEQYPKPPFTATKQNIGKVNFKVTLGIMPDYSYTEGDGLRVDAVSAEKPAKAAGVQEGDIIVQLGTCQVQGMQTYMDALSNFEPGDTTTVVVKRKDKMIKLPITFLKK